MLLVMKRVFITDRLQSQAMVANTVAPGHMPGCLIFSFAQLFASASSALWRQRALFWLQHASVTYLLPYV